MNTRSAYHANVEVVDGGTFPSGHVGARPGDVIASSQARAKRLKRMRKMTHKSRKAFSACHGIAQGTLQNWETARFGGLTEKGARIALEALRKEGIHCNFEWLMYGAGTGPSVTIKVNQGGASSAFVSTSNLVSQKLKASKVEDEIEMFYQLHRDATHCVVRDDTMYPQYSEGEFVVGVKCFDNIDALAGTNCIVETASGGIFFRYLRLGSSKGLYDLVCLNALTRERKIVMYDERLVSAAPVMWMRTEDIW